MKAKNFKQLFSILLTLCLILTFLPATVIAAADDVTLTIIHVNDRHGRMAADPYISELAENTNGNVLILDAGDALHGQITANLSKGAAMVELMNEVGYSAMVTGNHEYNYGIDRLLELSKMMDFPILAANVKGADGKNLFQSCEIFEMNGVTVGVFGLASPETVASSDPRIMQGLVFDDPVKTAQAEVAELKAQGCDIIIALTHLGLDDLSDPKDRSDTLASVDGIDVIIDGHSHTTLSDGLLVGDTLIAQTGEYGQNIGVVEITVSGDKTTKTAKIVPVPSGDDASTLVANEAIVAKIAELDKANEEVTSVVVGYTPVFMQGEKANVRTAQSNLADLITDSMRHATGADIAVMTGGNIRASIDVGDITMGEVLTTLPYSNLLTTVELTGADMLKVLEHGVDMFPDAVGHYIHVSGLSFTFDPSLEAGSRVLTVNMPDGSELSPDKTYTVATIDFLSAGGDGYDMLANGKNLKYYGGDAEAFVSYLATKPEISAEAENRAAVVTSSPLYVVMPDATHGFMAESIRHAEDELMLLAEQTGLTYKLCKTADAALQSDYLDEAIQANAAAVVLWPMTGDALRDAAQRVMDAGIPLIVYDRLIEGFEPDSEVLGDNMKIARMAGEYFNNYFAAEIASGETISILELAGDDSTVPKQRTQGFMEIAGDNVSVEERFDTQWRRDTARDQMANWLETSSDEEIENVQAIYAHEDETVLGAMDAISAYNGSAELNIRLVIGLGGKRDLIMHTGFYKEQFNTDLVTYQFSPAMIREAINDGAKAAAGEMPHKLCLIDTFEIHCHTLADYLASETYKTRYTTAMPGFDDISQKDWFYNAVSSIAVEGYMGTGGMFNPNAPVTEKEACELLDKLLLYVKAVHSHENSVLTREQLALLIEDTLHNYIIHKETDYHYADEANINPDCLPSVMCVYRLGLMRGIGGDRFDPKGVVTRAQMATVISNLMNACLTAASMDTAAFNTLSDFEGARIGALTGTVFAEFIDPVVQDVSYTYFPTQEEMVEALTRGEVDAISLDMPVAIYVAAQNAGLTVFPEVLSPDSYGFALTKGSPLADKANEVLQKLKADGTIAELEAIWFSADQSVKTLPVLDYKSDFDGSAGTLRYGCSNSVEPMSYINADGQPCGFDLDVVSRIAYELNMKVEFFPMSFDKVFTSLVSGELDMAGGSMSLTEQRLEAYSCVGPYSNGGVVLVVQDTVNYKERPPVEKSRLGVMVSSTNEKYAASHYPEAKINRYNNYVESAGALLKNEIDYSMMDYTSALSIIRNNKQLEIVSGFLTDEKLCFGINKNNPELAKRFSDVLDGFLKDGTVDEITSRWIKPDGSDYTKASTPVLESAPVIKAAIIATREPTTFVIDNEYAGLDIELIDRIAYELGYRVEYVNMELAGLLTAMENGEADICMGIYKTPEREQQMLFTASYFMNPQVLIAKK